MDSSFVRWKTPSHNHFADDSLLSVRVDQDSVAGARDCLSVFCEASGAIVSDHKMDYWLVGLDEALSGFLTGWLDKTHVAITCGETMARRLKQRRSQLTGTTSLGYCVMVDIFYLVWRTSIVVC